MYSQQSFKSVCLCACVEGGGSKREAWLPEFITVQIHSGCLLISHMERSWLTLRTLSDSLTAIPFARSFAPSSDMRLKLSLEATQVHVCTSVLYECVARACRDAAMC